jgi:CheY-like chemotaxis protein
MEKLTSVLLIDDDPTTNFINKKLIEGFEVTNKVEIAKSGEEALELIKHYIQSQNEDKIPQVIFVDIDMPFMDGFQFLEAYQALDFKNKDSVVTVILTSSISPQDMNRAKDFSVGAYIVKPLSREKMMELMQEYFGWQVHSD